MPRMIEILLVGGPRNGDTWHITVRKWEAGTDVWVPHQEPDQPKYAVYRRIQGSYEFVGYEADPAVSS